MEQPAARFGFPKRTEKRLPGCIAQPCFGDAGWSSPVARQAHNLKVVGSNPTPATTKFNKNNGLTKGLDRKIGAFVRFGANT